MALTFGSLFAGIGGFDLGLERAGMTCKWQVEIDEYCQRVLAKHWPTIKRHDDIRTFRPTAEWSVDVVAGGFPCQDISRAGHRIGIGGKRSGLWTEFQRIVCTLRPQYVLVENVADLLVRGIDRVLGDLAACGYDATWDVLAASDFGAPHIRERVFIVASLADTKSNGQQESRAKCWNDSRPGQPSKTHQSNAVNTNGQHSKGVIGRDELSRPAQRCDWWATEPDVDRVANGIPNRVDRLRGLGNAVVPQVAEWIGRRIVERACLEG